MKIPNLVIGSSIMGRMNGCLRLILQHVWWSPKREGFPELHLISAADYITPILKNSGPFCLRDSFITTSHGLTKPRSASFLSSESPSHFPLSWQPQGKSPDMQAMQNDTKDAALNAVHEKPITPQVQQINSSWTHLVAGA